MVTAAINANDKKALQALQERVIHTSVVTNNSNYLTIQIVWTE